MVADVIVAVVIAQENEQRATMSNLLRQVGMTVNEAISGRAGVELSVRIKPDLVVVGFGLPDIDGVETIRRLHASCDAFLLAVMDVSEEIEVVLAYDAGADSCCPTPLREREFRAQVDAFSRRHVFTKRKISAVYDPAVQVLRHGELSVDVATWEVSLDGKQIDLTATEFTILHMLMLRPGRVRSKKELARRIGLDGVEDENVYVSSSDVRSIEVHVANLRRKLGDSARESHWIETIRGVGYRMVNDPSAHW